MPWYACSLSLSSSWFAMATAKTPCPWYADVRTKISTAVRQSNWRPFKQPTRLVPELIGQRHVFDWPNSRAWPRQSINAGTSMYRDHHVCMWVVAGTGPQVVMITRVSHWCRHCGASILCQRSSLHEGWPNMKLRSIIVLATVQRDGGSSPYT